MQYIAFDCHKRYTFASVEDERGKLLRESRIEHRKGAFAEFLRHCEPGSSVAIETVGNWYWIVDEVEAAGMWPQLVHARKAKLMLAMVNKTDRLDCHGLNRLQRTGTLPSVWIPPGEIRDMRDLPRTRMVLSRQRTRLKNRIHAALAKYGLSIDGTSDAFVKRGREEMQ
jgi:transposase